MNELIEILKAMTAKKADMEDSRELFLDVVERVVKAISGGFGSKADEVALLILTADGKHLRFAAPRKFVDLGTIPISKRDSIAVGVFQKKSGEALNNVPMVKHVAFFESVKLRDKVAPIQKMVTVPILLKGDAVGVAQVSRKGETPGEAGPDFTPADVAKLQQLLSAVAPFLVSARPEKF
jgi:hypothetical protein